MTTPLEAAASAVEEIAAKCGNDWKNMSVDDLRTIAHGLMQASAGATVLLVERCDGDQSAAEALIRRAGRLANGVMQRHDSEFVAALERGDAPKVHLVAAHVARMLREISHIARLIESR